MRKDEGVPAHLGLELTPERVVATMPVDGRHRPPFGRPYGGVSVVLAEKPLRIFFDEDTDQVEALSRRGAGDVA